MEGQLWGSCTARRLKGGHDVGIKEIPIGLRSGQKGHLERAEKASDGNNAFRHVPPVTFLRCQKAVGLLGLPAGMGDPLCPVPGQVSAPSPWAAVPLGALGILGTLEAGIRLLEELTHSSVPLNPHSDSDSSSGW